MALSTFTPSQGLWAGQAYTLPPTKSDFKTAAHVNRLQNAMQENEEADGVTLTRGTLPMFRSFGEVQAIFVFDLQWRLAQGYNAGQSGLYTALYDFASAVIDGGEGTLVDSLPTGTRAGKNGPTITQRVCQAIVNGDYNPDYLLGGTINEFTLTLMVPTCGWTYPNGQFVAFH